MASADTTVNKQEDKFANLIGPTDPGMDRVVREKPCYSLETDKRRRMVSYSRNRRS